MIPGHRHIRLVFLSLVFYCGRIHSQSPELPAIVPAADSNGSVSNEKDIVDVFRSWFHLKPSGKSERMKPGDKPVLSVLPAIGYTLQTRLAAIASGNIAFYNNHDSSARLSFGSANIIYTQNKQFTIPVALNIWVHHDQINLLSDWRYMKYPQSTFGLGSNTHLGQENPMTYHYARIYQYVLKRLAPDFSAGLGYTLDYHWGIKESGVADGTVSDYVHYGAQSTTTSTGPALMFFYDSRKNPINATQGLAASLVVRDNLRQLGSSSSWQSLLLDLRKYILLSHNGANILALWSYTWIILHGKPPYLDLPSNGWDAYNNTGRGYIQGRFRGNSMFYFESEYRFRITPNGLFGGVLFANAESFAGASSRTPQHIQPASGLGLRIRLNKKSSTNIAIDYGFGTEGMRGLFVNVGEVF